MATHTVPIKRGSVRRIIVMTSCDSERPLYSERITIASSYTARAMMLPLTPLIRACISCCPDWRASITSMTVALTNVKASTKKTSENNRANRALTGIAASILTILVNPQRISSQAQATDDRGRFRLRIAHFLVISDPVKAPRSKIGKGCCSGASIVVFQPGCGP